MTCFNKISCPYNVRNSNKLDKRHCRTAKAGQHSFTDFCAIDCEINFSISLEVLPTSKFSVGS